ncbi:hypothetical protein [Microcystis sp. BLCC-F210]|jgi:hypothetical protein|uniref:hypothetical protein n=1 Tax=Microcystis TaxID=1125 RepID=UPI0035C88003
MAVKPCLNLINQLLSCNDGDEPRIVQKNQELLDEGLVKVMVAVAQCLGDVKYLSKINYTYLTPPYLLPFFTRKFILHDYLY